MRHYIGIDPGKTGGIAVVDENGEIIDCSLFSKWLDMSVLLQSGYNSGKSSLVLLEEVHAMPGQGVSSMFNFGANYGGWVSLLEATQIPYVSVRPQKWQKYILGTFPKGESKIRAYEYVTKRYPKLNLKKKDSGIVDAICMALYLKDNH